MGVFFQLDFHHVSPVPLCLPLCQVDDCDTMRPLVHGVGAMGFAATHVDLVWVCPADRSWQK